MIKTTLVALSLLLGETCSRGLVAQTSSHFLDAVELEATAIDDSGAYFVYHLRVVNSASSRSGVGEFTLDLSAPPGTGTSMLPSTGGCYDGDAHGVGPITDRVPIGVIDPTGWGAGCMRDAVVFWSPKEGYLPQADGHAIPISEDSAPPGGAKEGFGLRSPFLPGIRRFTANPTLASCCSQLEPGRHGEYPSPGEFRVTGFTVAPLVPPASVSLQTVAGDVQQVCGTLAWVKDSRICSSLRSTLEQAWTSSHANDREGTTKALQSLVDLLDGERGNGNAINSNAYWLLRTNMAYLVAHP